MASSKDSFFSTIASLSSTIDPLEAPPIEPLFLLVFGPKIKSKTPFSTIYAHKSGTENCCISNVVLLYQLTKKI